MPPSINLEALEQAVRHELVPIVNRNADTLIGELKSLVGKAAKTGTMLKKDGYAIGKTGKALKDEFVTFTHEHANAVTSHLEHPANIQEIHHAVSLATKGPNLERIAKSAQDGRGLNVLDITHPIAEPNRRVKAVLQSVPKEVVPFKVMDGALQNLEREHDLDGVIMEHIGNAAAHSRDRVRQAIKKLPEGEAFLDALQAEDRATWNKGQK
jgi:hypothetical protein